MAATAPANQTVAQGVEKVFTLGSFADPTGATGPWTVTINWGDGSANTVFTTDIQGALPAQSHAYFLSGTLTATVGVSNGIDASTLTIERQLERRGSDARVWSDQNDEPM